MFDRLSGLIISRFLRSIRQIEKEELLHHYLSETRLHTDRNAAQPHEHLESDIAHWSLFIEQRDNHSQW